MARIRGRGNKDTEMALAKLLRANGITGWRRHTRVSGTKSKAQSFTVKPDFVFHKQRVAVFVDGCFWHGCPKHATQPKNNHAFWQKKLGGNKARDRKVNRMLRRNGWTVLRIWEHTLRWATVKSQNEVRLLRRIQRVLV